MLPIISDVECLFTCLIIIHMPSLERYLFKSFAHFALGGLFLVVEFWFSLYLDINPSFRYIICKHVFVLRVVFYSVDCAFSKI